MRLLTVRHVTVYPYAEPVRLGEHRMMFRPRESHDLRLMLRTMTLRIQDEFAYAHRGERGVQSPGVTMQRGRGTCRDFAWLMIDAVRSLGLAARVGSISIRPTALSATAT